MKSGKVGNFFLYVGIITTLNYVKKMFDFYLESLDEPHKKNRSIFFLYDYKNINPSQQPKPKINESPSSRVTTKFKPGKSSGVRETE